ncbi:MAG: FtsX-like permease family protein [Candidatus Kariarchaeaceae archaeon]|jgi:ABC-type antimicrobial peptide transport system permease subunit
MVIAFPLALTNVPENLNQIIIEEREEYKLAHYAFFFVDIVNENVGDKIQIWTSDYLGRDYQDIIVEGRIHDSSKMKATGNNRIEKNDWLDLDIISYEAENPMKINQLKLDAGRFPETDTELVILSSLAESDGLTINDEIIIFGTEGPLSYQITGMIQSIEYSSFDLSRVGALYMNLDGLSRYQGRELNGSMYNSFLMYFNFELEIEIMRSLYEFLKFQLDTEFESGEIEEYLVFTWFLRHMSYRKSMQDALELTSQYLMIASVFIFIVAGVIIFVTMNRYVNEQKRTIGSMYAFGVRKNEIVQSFFFRIFILSLISGTIGIIVGKYFLDFLVTQLGKKWGLISNDTQISSESIFFTLSSAAFVAYGFTYLALWNLIKLTPYEAMRGKSSELKSGGLLFYIANLMPYRFLRGAAKNLTRNRTRTLLTIIAFSLSITFSGSLMFTHDSVGNTSEEYFENRLNYDLEVNLGTIDFNDTSFIDQIRSLDTNEDGLPDIVNVEPVVIAFTPITSMPEKLTVLISLPRETVMFDLSNETISEGRWFRENSSEVVISRYVAGTLGLQIGKTYSLSYIGQPVNMTVVGITNELMASATVFMDIRYLSSHYHYLWLESVANRILVNLGENVDVEKFQDVLNQDFQFVDITLSREYYENRFNSLAGSQTEIINLLITLGLGVGFISIFTTLLISIVERERELGLLHVYGNYKHEIFFQLLVEGLFLGLIAFLPGLVLAQLTSEHIWIVIISESLFEITPIFVRSIQLYLVAFSLVCIFFSVLVSFVFVTNKKLAEIIHEE